MSLSLSFSHSYPGFGLDISFDVPSTGATVLFGPSGSGKSTTAAVLAGLLRPQSIYLRLGDSVLADSERGIFVPAERRRVGMAFQHARLFPHLNVAGNLRYGARRASRQFVTWEDVIRLLELAPLLDRTPAKLSGGERQRVSIGRALLAQPRLLVLDEPFAGLDKPRRDEIMPFLVRLKDHVGLPMVYVTHDIDEVAQLGDTVVVLGHGRVVAHGPVADLAARADLPLATLDRSGAVLDCTIAQHLPERRLTQLLIALAPDAPLLIPLIELGIGECLRIRIPAREVILAISPPAAISAQNLLPVEILNIREGPTIGSALLELRLGKAPVLARITMDSVCRLGLVEGGTAMLMIKSSSIDVLAAHHELSLPRLKA